MASLQSDTTSLTVLFIHAFSHDRDNILNPSSCIHERSLLLNVWRYENRRERERYYFCFRDKYKWKTADKASSSGNLCQAYKEALALAGPGKEFKHPNYSIFPSIWNGLIQKITCIYGFGDQNTVINIVLVNSDLKSWIVMEEVLLWPSKLVLRGYQDSSRSLSFIYIWIYL